MSSDKAYYYFLGIGGIGMSALARWFASRGKTVMGYDRTPSAITTALELEGIDINYNDSDLELPQLLRIPENRNKTLVVYTPAIPSDNRQLAYFVRNEFDIVKRAKVLGELCRGMYTIAVAGTHGKTTTSCMVAHILTASGRGCNAFLGGIAADYGTNLLLNPTSDIAVVEADEFDRSFLQLSPDAAIITSTDADHLDIYGRAEEVKASFEEFASQVKPGGLLITRSGLDLTNANVRSIEYSIDRGNVRAEGVRMKGASWQFTIVENDGRHADFELPMPGRHNLENALAAYAAARHTGVSPQAIRTALKGFGGVKRRWEILFRSDRLVLVDDYAHHPTELRAAIGAARECYPGWPVHCFFQPHLYSRTRDFEDDFASALSEADSCRLLPIYPARELPIAGVTSERLLSKMTGEGHVSVAYESVIESAANIESGVIMMLGAGDIDRLCLPLVNALKAKHLSQ